MPEVSYNLINQIPPKSSANSTDVLAIATSTGATNSITVNNLFSKLSGLRTSTTAGVLLGTNNSGIISNFTVANGLSIDSTGLKINGVNAGTATKGVAQFNSSYFTDNGAGTISIKESGISHANIGGKVLNEHINHANVSITGTGYLNGGGDLTASKTVDINPSKRTSAYSSTGDKVAITDSGGYLNALVRDLVYIQLFPIGEVIATSSMGAPVAQFWVPNNYKGKSIKKIGMTCWTTATLTIGISNSTPTELTTLSMSNAYFTESGALNISCNVARFHFYVKSVTGTPNGLDVWMELG